MENMENKNFDLNDMEKDVIGEVMNISMGAAATAMSTILDKKVSITTPRIESMAIDEFEFTYLEPVIGVLIKYIEGIDGTNILLMREDDFKKILGHLLSTDPAEMTELDEISTSAICEIMNQMMGSSASALASFLGETVNISTPEIIDTKNREGVRELFSITGDSLVSIKFDIKIEDLIESEFISAMDPQLARKIIQMSMNAMGVSDSQEEEDEETRNLLKSLEEMEDLEDIPMEVPVQEAEAPPLRQSAPQAPPSEGYEAAAPPYQAPPSGEPSQAPANPGYPIKARDYKMKELGTAGHGSFLAEGNLELVMSVPIQITVELGKTRKKIKDIADLTVGNIIELDRQAGDQVDVIANGRLIAKGDVVVVDDNYSVRITEIVKNPGNHQELK